MSEHDDVLARNRAYAERFGGGELPARPARRVAVLACMDARLDVAAALGLELGEAHVIRNAGGVATEDAIRSLVISQRLLGTEEIVLVHHSDCGMERVGDEELRSQLCAETGIRPCFSFEAFPDAEADLRQTAARLRASPFVRSDRMRGLLYDVSSGLVREVPLD